MHAQADANAEFIQRGKDAHARFLAHFGLTAQFVPLVCYDPTSAEAFTLFNEATGRCAREHRTQSISVNRVEENAGGVGIWGGTCTCPDGTTYEVGDNGDFCETIACVGGVAGECHKEEGLWANRRVVCARPAGGDVGC